MKPNGTNKNFEKFTRIETLGEGTYGKVYKVKRNKEEYAIKRFFNTSKSDKIYGVVALRELDFLARLRSPFINCAQEFIYGNPFDTPLLKIKGFRDDKVFIVLPLAEYSGHDLKRKMTVKYIDLKRMMYQLLQGLYYMHSLNICHRDIKPGNTLIFETDGTFMAKWTDFGMCKHLTTQDKNSTYVSTSIYKPPELLLDNENYGLSFDIWSLGCLFYEIITREDMFTGDNDNSVLQDVFRKRGTPSLKIFREIAGEDTLIKYKSIRKRKKQKMSKHLVFEEDEIKNFEEDGNLPNFGTFDEFTNLLENMLKIGPSERYTAWQCLEHQFFSKIPTDEISLWKGLKRQKKITVEYHTLKKINDEETRQKGLETFKNIRVGFVENGYRISFLGLDIYDRCLLALEKRLMLEHGLEQIIVVWPKQGSKKNDGKFNYRLLAACSCYIACKYFIDEGTPRLNKIFPINKFKVAELEAMEKFMLEELLQYKIYRTTVFDILQNKCDPEILFHLLMEKDVYGYPIDVIANMYAKHTD